MPTISVIMPAYNAELYIVQAIESILSQTLCDFEFLIYNDGSTDKTHEIISSFTDSRIVYKNIEKNSGYLNLLNDGLITAKGKYIARMDADDIALPNRFEEQYKYLEANPEVGICGSWYEFIGNLNHIHKSAVTFEEIQYSLFFGCPLTHPSVMMRNELIQKHSLRYNSEYYYAEDHYFFAQGAMHFKVVNIPQVLLKYRIHNHQVGSAKWKEQFLAKSNIQAKLFCNVIISDNENSLKWLSKFFIEESELNEIWMEEVDFYAKEIISGNKKLQLYPQEILERAVHVLFNLKKEKNIYKYYFQKYYNRKTFNPQLIFHFFKEKHQPQVYLGKKLTLLFILKCLIWFRKRSIIRI